MLIYEAKKIIFISTPCLSDQKELRIMQRYHIVPERSSLSHINVYSCLLAAAF